MRVSALAWLALPLLAGLAYASALHNPFVYDDLAAITDNTFIRQLRVAPLFLHGGLTSDGFANGQFRPLTVLSFALNYQVGADNPFGYRLINLILHTLNAVLGARLLRALLLRVPFQGSEVRISVSGAHAVALLAAALFVVHPVNSLGVLLVWKRATLLATLCSLVAVSCLLALRKAEPARQGWRRMGLHVGVWVSQCLALGAKETAAVLPAILLLVDLWPRAGWQPRARSREFVRLHLPSLLLGVAGAVFLLTRDAQKVEMGRLVYLATQAKVIWGYAAMMVAPTLISVVYDVLPATPGDVLAYLGALALVGVLLASTKSVRRWPFVALALCWAALGLGPTSSLVPIPLLKDEDRAYLAFLLLWAIPAYGLVVLFDVRSPRLRIAARLGCVLVLLTLIGFTVARGALWSNAELLWRDAVNNHPDSRTASDNYCAAILAQPDKAPQAVAVCFQTYQRDPTNPKLQANLVAAYLATGATERAEALLAASLQQGKESPRLLRLAGHLAWFRDQPREAIRYYRRVLLQQPFDLESILYMARSYAELGATEEARSLTVQLDRWTPPSDPSFRLALADLHRAVGLVESACAEFRALQPSLNDRRKKGPDYEKLVASCADARGPAL